jgi:hypothetical protein
MSISNAISESKTTTSVDSGVDFSLVTEIPQSQYGINRGLYESLDREFFVSDTSSTQYSFNSRNGAPIIEFPASPLLTEEDAQNFRSRLVTSLVDVPGRSYQSTEVGNRAREIHHNLGENLRQVHHVPLRNAEILRTYVYNLVGAERLDGLYNTLLHVFNMFSGSTLAYITLVITQMGGSMDERFVYFAVVFTFFRSIMCSVVNVRYFARNTVSTFIEIFTRALSHARLDVSRLVIPNISITWENVLPSYDALRAAVGRDLQSIRAFYARNPVTFWVGFGGAAFSIVLFGLRNPAAIAQTYGFLSRAFSSVLNRRLFSQFFEVFRRTRAEEAARIAGEVVNQAPLNIPAAAQPFVNHLQPLLVDGRMEKVIKTLRDFFY